MRIFHLSNYSFTTKVILSFFVFISLFMLMRFILIVPKIEEKSLHTEINTITNSLQMIKEQLNITSKAIIMQSDFEKSLRKKTIENELKEVELRSKKLQTAELINLIKKNPVINSCSYKIIYANKHYEQLKHNRRGKQNDLFSKNNTSILKQWYKYTTNNKSWNFRAQNYFFYNYPFKDDNLLLCIACGRFDLNPNHVNFGESLKKHVRTSLLIDPGLKSTKVALFWVNPDIDAKADTIMFQRDKYKRKQLYSIATPSNVENIPTGNLTVKEIFQARDKHPVEHIRDGKKVITWITDLSIKSSFMNSYYFLAYSIDKKELENKNRAKLFFLLPEIFAIGISFLIILFLFRRVLKNISTLTKTALKVNQGVKNIRSNVKGEDDIGILGQSFDSMLDFFENSIKTLDSKVEEKTQKIQHSLEEKEILLKEIHHRVKNNLALTISLIELQEEDIKDIKTKKVLVDIQERIYTMELLHRKLYESENLNEIPFKNYVEELTEAIAKTYDREKKVAIDIQMQKINFNIQTAMPYGLVLNELITNAFKYAFKEQKEFKLLIKIVKQNNEKIQIIVQDNGKGLKENFSKICNETLGLKLINMIVKYQLHGTITYRYNNGAQFIIEGDPKKYLPNNF